jgi:nucleoside-diphosphate-sugar epimerase
MTTLVLGVGYVGSALVADLLSDGERVVALDNFFASDASVVRGLGPPERFHLVEGSVLDPAALDAAFEAARGADVVYNLAAQASARPDAAPPEYTEDTNLRGPRLVLEAQRRFGVRTQVYASSLRVYGDSLPASPDESAPYGRFSDLSHLSKAYVEKLLEMHVGLAGGGLLGRSVRLGLVYGPAPVMKLDYRFMTAPNKFCLQVARGEDLTVWGESRLGLIHVGDAVRALRRAADPSLGGYAAVNAAAEATTVPEVARLVVEAARQRGLAARVSPPIEGEPRPAESVPSRLRSLGFAPGHCLAEGIAETLDYFVDRVGPATSGRRPGGGDADR